RLPNRACPAVAPRATTTAGSTAASSAPSQRWQAATSPADGFWWIRRFPLAVHLKCLTALVTYTSSRFRPTSAMASARIRPAGPTNGSPALSSESPGCSPTKKTRASPGPRPNTVWVAWRYSSQARQPAASAASRVSSASAAGARVVFAIASGIPGLGLVERWEFSRQEAAPQGRPVTPRLPPPPGRQGLRLLRRGGQPHHRHRGVGSDQGPGDPAGLERRLDLPLAGRPPPGGGCRRPGPAAVPLPRPLAGPARRREVRADDRLRPVAARRPPPLPGAPGRPGAEPGTGAGLRRAAPRPRVLPHRRGGVRRAERVLRASDAAPGARDARTGQRRHLPLPGQVGAAADPHPGRRRRVRRGGRA